MMEYKITAKRFQNLRSTDLAILRRRVLITVRKRFKLRLTNPVSKRFCVQAFST